ncbi:MAG: alpha/beta fold hydrolase, partial [Pseudomonadota bacterium]
MSTSRTLPARKARRLLLLIVALLLLVAAAGYVAGSRAIAPTNREVGPPPAELNAEAITIKDSDGLDVAAWLADPDPAAALIILAHGNRSDRRSLIGRAVMLARAGYAVLLLDLRAHGESPGAHRSFGHGEARSVAAAIGYVRSRWPSRKVGLIGISLGGASAIVAARQARADAYVLEAVYSDLRTAAQNRFAKRLGALGRITADIVLLQVPWRLGFDLDELSMTARIPEIKAPVLMIAGDRD